MPEPRDPLSNLLNLLPIQHSHKPGSIDDKSTLDAISREGSTVGAYQASFGQGYFCVCMRVGGGG